MSFFSTNGLREEPKYIKQFDLIHTSCYSEIERELYKLNNLDIPISFDFSENFKNDYLKKVCPYLTFSFFSCADLSKDKSINILNSAVKNGSEIAVATRGENGVILLYNNNIYQQKSKNITPKDTLGAGDTFITAFLLEILKANFKYKDKVLKKGLESGVNFAAESCQVLGAFGHGKQINNS